MAEKTPQVKTDRVPNDLIHDILLRLPVKSIARFRCISKSWLSISTDPSFLLAHTNLSPHSLLIHTANKYSNDFSIPINLRLLSPALTSSAGLVVVCSILQEGRRNTSDVVFASCDGLICVRDGWSLGQDEEAPYYYVINPRTGFYFDVPKPNGFLRRLMGLYFHPPTCEYRLIGMISSYSFHDKVELLTLGGEAWRTIEASAPREYCCSRSHIYLKGSLYWIARSCSFEFSVPWILRFHTVEEEFKLMPQPP